MTELTQNNNSITKENKQQPELAVVTPRVDIMETETSVLLVAEMPGVSQKTVDVDLQGNNLTIKGTTDFKAPEGVTMTCGEYSQNKAYERQFTIGESIDLSNITASMKDGILRLTLPKVKELAPRRITVRTE